MADRNVPTTDSFEQWRVSYNSSSTDIGDISALNNTFSGTPTDLVEACNNAPTLGFTIAMCAALG